MGNMLGKPKVEAAPAAKEATPLPIRDDDAERREKIKTWASASKRGGEISTRVSRVGDSDMAQTRTGSAVLGSG
jgi:hypothetical protein